MTRTNSGPRDEQKKAEGRRTAGMKSAAVYPSFHFPSCYYTTLTPPLIEGNMANMNSQTRLYAFTSVAHCLCEWRSSLTSPASFYSSLRPFCVCPLACSFVFPRPLSFPSAWSLRTTSRGPFPISADGCL